ncbi:MAG: hypothetical protein VXY46_03030, partial [Pseudomonadota bacterium]|nr:hypothetical protein [Pseudomonadota bacterium]
PHQCRRRLGHRSVSFSCLSCVSLCGESARAANIAWPPVNVLPALEFYAGNRLRNAFIRLRALGQRASVGP